MNSFEKKFLLSKVIDKVARTQFQSQPSKYRPIQNWNGKINILVWGRL